MSSNKLILRYFLSILSCLLFILIWWLIIYRPIKAIGANYKSRISALNIKKKKCLDALNYCANLNKNIKLLQSKFSKKDNNQNNSIAQDEIHYTFSHIIDCLNQNKIKLIASNPEKVIVSNHYTIIPFILNFEANWKNMIDFFKCVSSSDSYIICNFANVVKGSPGIINCKCKISFLIDN